MVKRIRIGHQLGAYFLRETILREPGQAGLPGTDSRTARQWRLNLGMLHLFVILVCTPSIFFMISYEQKATATPGITLAYSGTIPE